jgi:crossover junction endodeoxyribonuclease RuvC
MCIVIGIDPGLDGAMAILKGESVTVVDLPTRAVNGGSVTRRVDGRALSRIVREHCSPGVPVVVCIEDLSAGGRDSSAQTVGSQYRTRGTIEATIEILGLHPEPVMAQRWKKLFGLTKDKKTALTVARELFPQVADDLKLAKHHNRAEALLIAQWARKVIA